MIDRSGGVMDKYTKHRFFTALVLEIRASLYSTPLDAIFISKFSPLSETHRTLKNLTSEVHFLYASEHNTELLSKIIIFVK